MAAKSSKQLEIIAGPNGSGKTTFAQAYFKLRNGKSRFINADTIAVGLSSGSADQAAFHAGRVMLKAIEEALEANQSFAFESTLSGKTWLKTLAKARGAGYSITIYFVFLKSAELNLRRIKARVREGGHDIPKSTVIRRYARSFQNFWNVYRHECDSWYIFDNSGNTTKQIQSNKVFEALAPEAQQAFIENFLP